MASGGRRLGAGRRSDADITRLRDIMAKYVTDDDWGEMIAAMQAQARKGNVRAFIALTERQFGLPGVPSNEPDEEPLRIRTVSIIDSTRSDSEDNA